MATNIGPRIGIEGEDQFRKELVGIGNDLKVLASESKAVAAEFANTTNAEKGLSAQNDVLTKQAEDLNKQLEIQEKAYQAAREQLGETDKTTQQWEIALNNTKAQLAQTEGAIEKNNEQLAQMRKEKFEDVIKGIGTAFAGVGAAAVAAGAALGTAVAGVIKGAKETAELGDNIDKMSQKLGMSTTKYQEWSYILELAGTDIDSMTTGMKTLTNKIDDAKNGSEKAQAMFTSLGISLEDLNSMSREDAFEAVVKGMQGMADSTDRAALANDLFGKSGQNLTPLFNQTAEETERQIELAHEYGMVMSEDAVKASADFNDSLTTLEGALTGLKNQAMSQFLPAMTDVAEGLAAVVSGDNAGMDQIKKGIQEFMTTLSASLPQLIELGGSIVNSLFTGIVESLPEIVTSAAEIIQTLLGTFVELLPDIIGAAALLITTLVQGIADSMPELIPVMIDAVILIADTLIENVGQLIPAALQIIVAIAEGIIKALPQLAKKVPEIVTTIIKVLTTNLPEILSMGGEILIELITGIIKAIPELIKAMPQIIKAIVQGLLSGLSQIASVGLDLVKGLWEGIKNSASWLLGKMKEWCGSILKGIKAFFGIHSPSKKMAEEVGKPMAEGVAEGINKYADEAIQAAYDMGQAAAAAADKAFNPKDIAHLGKDEYQAFIMGYNSPVTTPTVSSVIAGAVNGLVSASKGNEATYSFQIVLPDGRLLAEYLFEPLTEYAKANGTPILNPV